MENPDRLSLLQRAQDALNTATTPTELQHAHRLLTLALKKQRREARMTSEGQLAAAFVDAMELIDQRRANGATKDEALEGFETVLKEAWPKGGRVWRYICELCHDTGWRDRECTPNNRCNGVSTFSHGAKTAPAGKPRLCATDARYTHTYVEPCMCQKGDAARAAVSATMEGGRRKRSLDDAGSESKPSRLGRR